ncbi:4'-phosphopantetheinyl transferase family protein [Massilia horti]|uniref:4'-phosphopantetheinyl transferase family protein n=1 Tax=Massilia horti TaxID=2562153 RepID=UPI001431E444|nr:4'-phosphopantetheinyl transferase superfamily protein [Massilia horti]
MIGVQGAGGRDAARMRIRDALHEALASLARLPREAVSIDSRPGHAPTVAIHDQSGLPVPGIAFSHEEPWSLAAINLYGPVGVDLMRVQDIPDWHAVARAYLGPETASKIAAAKPDMRPAAFTQAWCEHEARLKCHGLQLTEWTPALAEATRDCTTRPLALPDGLAGALAWQLGSGQLGSESN